MTAVEMLNDDVYIGGESDCNIFTLRRNAGGKMRQNVPVDISPMTLETNGTGHLSSF